MNSTPTKRPKRKRLRKFIRGIAQSRASLWLLSTLAIGYLKLVHRTNSYVVEPEDILQRIDPHLPVVVGVWHGQHIMLPVIPIGLNGSAMISRNFDGEVTARIVEHFGNRTIRASGGRRQSETLKKGGMTGFLEMLAALREGDNVAQTVDIPKGVARKAGLGIIMLAQRSGRPIVPLAIASSRRYVFSRAWDRAALNMPFGTTAICAGELISVSADANHDELEQRREELEAEMQRITARAYALTGNPE